jgi:hypothetical protein
VFIADGWNMTSVPGININGMGITDWWSGLTGTVYKFIPGSGYTGVSTTMPGEGYWMKQSGDNIYNTGGEWPAGGIQVVEHVPIDAIAGWNIFGGYEDTVNVTELTTTPPGQILYPVYKYLPGTGYQTAAQIEPGFGYWVKVASDCGIILPETAAEKTSRIADLFKNDWGRIIFTDASGSSYTLYAVKGMVDLSRYELPPLPPEGMFDIRYSSGRVAEDINTSAQGINMRGITYPVKIKVEGMGIKLQDATGKEINTNIGSGEEITVSNPAINKLMVSGEVIPDKYSLDQNYPNPFNPSTTINFALPEAAEVTLTIYNTLGQKVAELVNSKLEAGNYSYEWNARNVSTGMYIYELRTDKFVSVKKMLLLK